MLKHYLLSLSDKLRFDVLQFSIITGVISELFTMSFVLWFKCFQQHELIQWAAVPYCRPGHKRTDLGTLLKYGFGRTMTDLVGPVYRYFWQGGTPFVLIVYWRFEQSISRAQYKKEKSIAVSKLFNWSLSPQWQLFPAFHWYECHKCQVPLVSKTFSSIFDFVPSCYNHDTPFLLTFSQKQEVT